MARHDDFIYIRAFRWSYAEHKYPMAADLFELAPPEASPS